jgi:archaellum component FlaC
MTSADIGNLAKTIAWLEDENRQHKSAAFKVQQAADQLQGGVWTLSDRLNAVEGSLNILVDHSTRLVRVENDIHNIRELLEQLNSRFEQGKKPDAQENQKRQAEQDRERQAQAETTKQYDMLEMTHRALMDRVQAVEERARRRQEELFQVTQAIDGLNTLAEKQGSLLQAQQTRNEHLSRQIEEATNELQGLQGQDEVIQGRLQYLTDQVRRFESQAELRESETRLTQLLSEQGELTKVDRQRLERTLVEVQIGFEQYRSSVDDVRQELIQLNGKSRSQGEHLDQVREALWGFQNELGDQFSGWADSEEKAHRQHIAELEKQIKGLAAWRSRPNRNAGE